MKKILYSFLIIILIVSCDRYEDYDNINASSTDPEPKAVIGIKNANAFEITMANNSEDADSFVWDFGGGNTSTEMEPTYVFDFPGDYKVQLWAYSKDRKQVDLDSIRVLVDGKLGDAADFVGNFVGTYQNGEGSYKGFETTTTRVSGENAIMFGNLLKENRLLYESWGYLSSETTNDYAKIILKEDGIIEIPLQYMYHMDNGSGYVDDIYIKGRGLYNADTGTLSLEYIELFEGDDPTFTWDGETITERVIIATLEE